MICSYPNVTNPKYIVARPTWTANGQTLTPDNTSHYLKDINKTASRLTIIGGSSVTHSVNVAYGCFLLVDGGSDNSTQQVEVTFMGM